MLPAKQVWLCINNKGADDTDSTKEMPWYKLSYNKIANSNCTDTILESYRQALAAHKNKEDGVLYQTPTEGADRRLWVPPSLITQLLDNVHSQLAMGHPGQRAFLKMVLRYYYWLNIKYSITRFVANCKACFCNKTIIYKPNSLLRPFFILKYL